MTGSIPVFVVALLRENSLHCHISTVDNLTFGLGDGVDDG